MSLPIHGRLCQFGLRSSECDARFESANGREHVQIAALHRALRRTGDAERLPELDSRGKLKSRRHDADYRYVGAIQRNRTPDDAGIAGETARPQTVTQYDHPAVSKFSLI